MEQARRKAEHKTISKTLTKLQLKSLIVHTPLGTHGEVRLGEEEGVQKKSQIGAEQRKNIFFTSPHNLAAPHSLGFSFTASDF